MDNETKQPIPTNTQVYGTANADHQMPPPYTAENRPYQQTNNQQYAPTYQQPKGSQPVMVQPQQQIVPMMVTGFEGHRTWTTGLCDCFEDPSICLMTWCAYQCSICYLGSRMGEHMCIPACVPASDLVLRNRLRTIGGIKGTLCNDCLTVVFCGPCAVCQAHRELTNMGVP